MYLDSLEGCFLNKPASLFATASCLCAAIFFTVDAMRCEWQQFIHLTLGKKTKKKKQAFLSKRHIQVILMWFV